MRVSAPIVMNLSRFVRASTGLFASAALAGCIDLGGPPEACSVTLAPSAITLPVNASSTLVGTAFDCDGESIRNKRINYSSSNTAVATVTTEGQVIALAIGTSMVSAVSDGQTASVPVIVTAEAVATITLTPSTITLRRTNTRQLSATALNLQNAVITGRNFRWGSSNSAVVQVDQNGLVSAITPGTAVITAEIDQRVGSATVQVTEVSIGSCSLAPTNSRITVTQSVQPSITLRDTSNNVISSLGRQIVWTSNNEVAATVTNTGLVTARRDGVAIITASPVENPQASCTSTVEVVNARIVSAVIAPRSGQLRLGIPRQLSVSLTDSAGGAIPPGRTVLWTTVTPTFANVSANGLVTGLGMGTARIAVNAEGVVDTVSFPVTRVPVATVRLSPLTASVVQGTPVQINAIVEDSTGSVVTDRLIEWSSSDPTRASVSSVGLVSTIAPGAVTITAISEGRQGTSTVTVQPIPVDSVAANDYTVAFGVQNKSFAIRLLDVNRNQLFNRNVSVVSSDPSVATGTANGSATVITVVASRAGTAIFSLRALNANNQPEGRITLVTVTITP